MYVADESDDRVYTYNLPDAIDARLASLTLSGVDIGEFSPNHEEYEGAAGEGVTETTVTAEALQRRTDVDIDPPDANVEAKVSPNPPKKSARAAAVGCSAVAGTMVFDRITSQPQGAPIRC